MTTSTDVLLGTTEVLARCGLTAREVHYWIAAGAIAPTVLGTGQGRRHLWSRRDLARLRAIARARRRAQTMGIELGTAFIAHAWDRLDDAEECTVLLHLRLDGAAA